VPTIHISPGNRTVYSKKQSQYWPAAGNPKLSILNEGRIVQNKPNLADVATNIILFNTGGYDDPSGFEGGKNKPNRS
jgi:hypothetical protein